MKAEIYHRFMAMQASRRSILKRGASAAAILGSSAMLGGLPRSVLADSHGSLRADILKIPGVGAGSPTDAEWQKVGEMCLGGTKETVAEGEFAGVELTFMGLNNQNLHNFLFRGFLKPWEAYTGATINWIDLAQADYNARLQQSIATGTVDFDIIEMGAPFEGDVCGKGLASEMPEWVAELIDMDDYVDYLKAPVGTWNGKTYRISIDGDCHTFAYRTDYYDNEDFATAWKEAGGEGDWAPPRTWAEVNAHAKFLKGKADPLTGLDAHGFLDPLKGWGGLRLLLPGGSGDRLCQAPGRSGLAVRSGDHDAARQQPGLRARDPGGDGHHGDLPRRIRSTPIPARPPSSSSWPVPARRSPGGVTSARMPAPRTHSVVGDVVGFDTIPGSDEVYNSKTGEWEQTPNEAPNMAYIGWGVYVMARVDGDEKKHKAAWSAAAHLGGKDLSLWASAYPSGFQPYRQSHFNFDEWEEAGYDRAFIEDYLGSNADSYNHPNAAIEPRIPGIFQYYSVAEDELAKGFAGQYGSAQETADAIAAAWEKITDQIGRDSQIALYKASIGL